jgi:hypothetical protein
VGAALVIPVAQASRQYYKNALATGGARLSAASPLTLYHHHYGANKLYIEKNMPAALPARDGRAFDAVSDAVDDGKSIGELSFLMASVLNNATCIVNVQKLKLAWNADSTFDAEKDKSQFRQYETACDRVKNFYREQHGPLSYLSACT